MIDEDKPRKGGVRAVGLMSGGLDSTLAAEMLRRQGVEVTGLHLSTGFCKVDHRRAMRRRKDRDPARLKNEALSAGAAGGFPVEVLDVSEEYLQIVLHPRYGYGSQANPCVDCRIFMLEKAKQYAEATGAEIVFTGEVIGQRPMSQHREALRLVEAKSGLEGRLLRPLSAHHMAPTRAERDGRIDRKGLGRIGGRSRREQERLAHEFGIENYPQPSGGCCYLSDPAYARRLRDLVAHVGAEAVTREDVVLLKVGRQFRLSPGSKIHVGREEAENAFLRRFSPGRWTLEAAGVEGPTAIVTGDPEPVTLELGARIVARYADLEGAASAEVRLVRAAPRELARAGPDEDRGVADSQMPAGSSPRAPGSNRPTAERLVLRVAPASSEAVESMRI